jgi:hypothetical protein
MRQLITIWSEGERDRDSVSVSRKGKGRRWKMNAEMVFGLFGKSRRRKTTISGESQFIQIFRGNLNRLLHMFRDIFGDISVMVMMQQQLVVKKGDLVSHVRHSECICVTFGRAITAIDAGQ